MTSAHKKRLMPASTSPWNQLTHYSKRPANYPQLSSGIKCQLDHNHPRSQHSGTGLITLTEGGTSATDQGGFFMPTRQLNTGRGGACHTIPNRGKNMRVAPSGDYQHPGCIGSHIDKNRRRPTMAQKAQDKSVHTTPTEIQALVDLDRHGNPQPARFLVIANGRYWTTDSLEKAREIAAAEGDVA